MLRIRIITFLVGVVLLFSCSQYQKVLKSNDYNFKYQEAVKYYESGEYYKAQSLFDELVSIFKGSDKAEDVLYYYADCHYQQRDYILAAYYFDNFAKTFPYSEKTEKAAYTAAYCYYLNSPRPSLDQTDTYKAINAMQVFINKFPKSEFVNEANIIMSELRDKLEKKSYESAKLYYKLSDFHAASISLKNNIKDFPDSEYREEVLYLIVKSSFMLAEMSVKAKQGERYQNTISEYYVFIDEYPESEYAKEVEKMYTKSVNQIKNL